MIIIIIGIIIGTIIIGISISIIIGIVVITNHASSLTFGSLRVAPPNLMH